MSARAAAAPDRLDALAARLRAALARAEAVRPAFVLGPLLALQGLALLVLAVTVRHSGWVYYAGGDQLWHYSGAYLLAHGHVPPSFVGYGWSILLLPVAAVAGPNLVSALPAIVLLDALVLLPVALLCVYGIGARIAGRLFGYWAAFLWIVVPYLGVLFVEPGYHQKYTELTLPQQLGLTPVPDFPSTVALLVAAYLALRAVDSGGWHAAAGAGLAAGYSIAMKPSNAIFLVVPALLFLVERPRVVLPFAAALAPPLLTLALWKYRGLGMLASAPVEPVRSAVGVGDLPHRVFDPQLNSWAHLHEVLLSFREHFWIARVIEWLPLAGAVALLLRSRRGFLLVGSWFAVYLVLKATYVPASVEDASFFRLLMPAFPAYLLLAAAVVLLFPGVRARPAPGALTLPARRLTLAVAAAALVFAVVPLAVVAAVPTLHDQGREAVRAFDGLTPVRGIGLRAVASGRTVRLTWRPQRSAAAPVFYRIMRAKTATDGAACADTANSAADDCRLFMEAPAATRATTWVDHPGTGTWTYRIGVSANWLDDLRLGDVYVTSAPATVTVR